MQAARSSSAQQQRAAAARSGSANPSKIATVRKKMNVKLSKTFVN